MEPLYPLCFEPIFQQYIWGGRRLESELGKTLPDGDGFAESWEIVDHGKDQSVVAAGAYQGWTLSRLVNERGKQLLGKHHPLQQFPLLFKFLDCQRNLSVQVHPNDVQGAQLDPPDLGKTEAWVIMAVEPGSCLYAGLKRGYDEPAFERELSCGSAELCLNKIEPKVGDCIFIPAGTVHALGEGLLVAEIQQSSNTTFRLFDWNRVGPDGKPRPLHIEQGLGVTDFNRGPVPVQQPQPTNDPAVERLVQCEKFVLDRCTFSSSRIFGGDNTCHIIAVIEGRIQVGGVEVARGQTTLIPADGRQLPLGTEGRAAVLDMYLP